MNYKRKGREKEYDRAWRLANLERHKQATAAWRAANPEKVRLGKRANRLAAYGLTIGSFGLLLKEQEYSCAICYMPLGPGHNTAVDHDHDTGVVRGLLCRSCNTGIGHLRDNAEVCRRAALYLQGRRDYA